MTLGAQAEAPGRVWHVPGAETVTTREFGRMVFAAVGTPPRLSVAPRMGIALLGLFDPTLRAVREQLYESERPFVVDHSRYARAFGADPTPHPAAIDTTLRWYRALQT